MGEQHIEDHRTEEPAPAPWQPRRDLLVLGILAIYFALAVATSYIHELGFGPDEVSRHLPYVEWLGDHWRLPPNDPTVEAGALELHPPLYYLALTPVYLVAKPYGRRAVLRALRWTSPFGILGALLLWFPVVRRACGGSRTATLQAFALTAWWPNLFVDAGLLNNDVGALLVSAWLVYLIADRHREDTSVRSAAVWGAVVGIGGLVKASVPLAAVPVVLYGLARGHGRRFYADRRFWVRGVVAALLCLAICGWWYLRQEELHGSFSGITTAIGFSPIPPEMTKLDAIAGGLVWPLLLRAINGLWVSVFAGAVWFPDWSRPVVYSFLRLVTALGAMGVALGCYRLLKRERQSGEGQAAAILAPIAGFVAIYLATIYVSVFVHLGGFQGGRYLLPFLPGLTVPLVLGLRQLGRPAIVNGFICVVVGLFLALNFLVWYHIITYWNPYVLQTAGPFH